MKKLIHFLFLSILLLSIVSCGKNTNQNDLEKMNLKGNIVLIKDGEEYIFFTDKGNIIKKYSGENDENLGIGNYFYIENRLSKIIRLTKYTFQNKIYKFESQETFNYDNDGNLTTSTIISGDGDLRTEITKYHFYHKGKLVKDSTLSDFIEFSNTQVDNFIYNGESLIRIDHTQINSGNVDNKSMSYSSDFYENGLVTKQINDEEQTFSFQYENDMKGNWVKQKRSDGEIVKREIFYKGDDISLYVNKYEEFKKVISSSSTGTNINENPTSNNEVVPEENNIQSNNTTQQQEKRKCYSCNGTGKCSKCMKAFRVHYWAGKGPGWKDENETRPGKIMCDDCHGAGVIYGRHPYGEDPEYKKCYVSACNNGWKNCPECNYNGNSNNLGQCQKCKGSGFDR